MATRSALPSQSAGHSGRTSRSASFAAGEASSSSQTRMPLRSAATDAGRIFSEAVLDRYLWLPGTPTRASRLDRRLVRTLYERGVPLAVVQAALLLGAARRTFRAETAPPLPPIRTLHYFLPLIEEQIEQPVTAEYLDYLESKLFPWADGKAERVAATRR